MKSGKSYLERINRYERRPRWGLMNILFVVGIKIDVDSDTDGGETRKGDRPVGGRRKEGTMVKRRLGSRQRSTFRNMY